MIGGVVTSSVIGRQIARRRHDEDDLQHAVITFLRWALPHDAMAWAIPNGGKRSPREAARMKGLGVVSGIPDIGICFRGRCIFLELKSARGVMSEAQKAMHKKLIYCGADVMLIRSLEDCEKALREACVPLRGAVQ